MPGPARIVVHCTPRAGRESIGPDAEGALEVRVTAPADGGKANAAVCKLVAKTLGVPKTSVTVVRGTTSRHKQIEIAGIDQADAERAIRGASSGHEA